MQEVEASIRKIIHIDMDAFYASVEQRDNPGLKNKPVIVGGKPNSRGVVSTCSYEARKYGIHSAMPSAQAYKLCPTAVFIPPEFEKYKYVSRQINEIFRGFTDLVEPLSLDEAFLDVTDNKLNIPSATVIAKSIRSMIFNETALTASAGVSFNKFLAKVASDINKPDGLTVITPKESEEFINKLPIQRFFGIGKVTFKKMKQLGIRNGYDLKMFSIKKLTELFGKNGIFYYNISRGRDERPVCVERRRKSYGREVTFPHDINSRSVVLKVISKLCDELVPLLQRNKVSARTVTLKIKYSDFKIVTRSTSFISYRKINKALLMVIAAKLIKEVKLEKSIRLAGISVSNIEDNCSEYFQPELELYDSQKQVL
ncbi:MAG: DNA polymerase IV [Victivallales bacterium]|nr:DNA polymerase IV [Victivallales bacterium]